MSDVESQLRDRLADLIRARGEDMAGLSRLIGRPAGYLARHVRQGTPARLPAHEQATLASYFGVHEDDLLPRTLREWRTGQLVDPESV